MTAESCQRTPSPSRLAAALAAAVDTARYRRVADGGRGCSSRPTRRQPRPVRAVPASPPSEVGRACAGCDNPLPSGCRADKLTHCGACRTRLWRRRRAGARDALVTGSSPTTVRSGDPGYTEPSPQDITAHRASDGHRAQSGRGRGIASLAARTAEAMGIVQLTLFPSLAGPTHIPSDGRSGRPSGATDRPGGPS